MIIYESRDEAQFTLAHFPAISCSCPPFRRESVVTCKSGDTLKSDLNELRIIDRGMDGRKTGDCVLGTRCIEDAARFPVMTLIAKVSSMPFIFLPFHFLAVFGVESRTRIGMS